MATSYGRLSSHRRVRRRARVAEIAARWLALTACVLLMAMLGSAVLARVGGDDAATSTAPASASAIASAPTEPAARGGAGPEVNPGRWLRLLAVIDARRTTAWRLGDPALLRSVYTRGSPELVEDESMLRAYLRRGLQVTGVEMRFSAVTVERRGRGSVSLLVVDRLEPAVAHDSAGRALPLPRDLPTRHRIELRMAGRQWRIAAITLA